MLCLLRAATQTMVEAKEEAATAEAVTVTATE